MIDDRHLVYERTNSSGDKIRIYRVKRLSDNVLRICIQSAAAKDDDWSIIEVPELEIKDALGCGFTIETCPTDCKYAETTPWYAYPCDECNHNDKYEPKEEE